ncbi:MAG: aspartate 1-decarboxylase [Ammonifex sp.]|jgi:aspartate 1-decarboxylase|nr:MAG: aspartate 1-decarboxylase [Ammonifex sp.]
MLLTMLRGKIHRATVTETNSDYVGSITIDEALLEAADILPGEKVQVANVDTGERFESYAITGPRDSGVICLNGAAALLAKPGERVIIMAYALVSCEEARNLRPRVALVDEKNRLISVKSGEVHGDRS